MLSTSVQSDIRFASPNDPYFSNVTYLTKFNGFSASVSSADVTGRHSALTGVSTTFTGVADTFGTGNNAAAINSPATNYFESTGTVTDWTRGTAPVWTVEFWFNKIGTGVKGNIMNCGSGWSFDWFGTYNSSSNFGGLQFAFGTASNGTTYNGGYIISANNSFPLSTWVHYAIAMDGTTARVFANGSLSASVACGSWNIQGFSNTLKLNNGVNQAPDYGALATYYIDEIRFTNACRYTTAFPKPVTPWPTH